MPYLDQLRFQRGAEHLWRLGPRATAEFLAELASTPGARAQIADLLAEYQNRLTPELLRATGGDRFPPRPLVEVPVDLGRVA